MDIGRRNFMTGAAALAALRPTALAAAGGNCAMYGLIGKMMAAPGQRDSLIALLVDGIESMPGCISYIVAKDPSDENAIWITEVWDSEASHKASLSRPAVHAAITPARPLIAGFGEHIITTPVGGHGLATPKAG